MNNTTETVQSEAVFQAPTEKEIFQQISERYSTASGLRFVDAMKENPEWDKFFGLGGVHRGPEAQKVYQRAKRYCMKTKLSRGAVSKVQKSVERAEKIQVERPPEPAHQECQLKFCPSCGANLAVFMMAAMMASKHGRRSL